LKYGTRKITSSQPQIPDDISQIFHFKTVQNFAVSTDIIMLKKYKF